MRLFLAPDFQENPIKTSGSTRLPRASSIGVNVPLREGNRVHLIARDYPKSLIERPRHHHNGKY
jgi:hypothetical protein